MLPAAPPEVKGEGIISRVGPTAAAATRELSSSSSWKSMTLARLGSSAIAVWGRIWGGRRPAGRGSSLRTDAVLRAGRSHCSSAASRCSRAPRAAAELLGSARAALLLRAAVEMEAAGLLLLLLLPGLVGSAE